MNRREFCLTTGLLLTGSVCIRAATVPVEKHLQTFRVKKVFLESWDAEIVRKDSPQAESFVRKRLEETCRDGYNGLLLVPGRSCITRWSKPIEMEANRLEITVLVPACLSADIFLSVQTVQRIDDDGVLLWDGSDSVLGLILYDVSRCRWTSFVSSTVRFAQDLEKDEGIAKLIGAQWLDRQFCV